VAKFLVDEDLPRSLARELRQAGIDAVDARDAGLRGHPDLVSLRRSLNRERARYVVIAEMAVTEDRAFLARLLASWGETVE